MISKAGETEPEDLMAEVLSDLSRKVSVDDHNLSLNALELLTRE